MQTACVVILLFAGLVFSQIQELISDPGLYSLSGNQCSQDNVWSFRSDYVWNDTEASVNARCAAYFEIPTPVQPGITKGDQTNINKALIPTLPTVSGAMGPWSQSAAVVDMNSACRAALWTPIRIPSANPASVQISLKLWVRSNDQIQQLLLENSMIPTADLLQYLRTPHGLLSEDFDNFPPIVEETNQIRIDLIRPDENGEFYDRAFSLIPNQIVANIPIPSFDDGNVVPANGTEGSWITITYDATSDLVEPGLYALRIASAQSQIGVSWGVSDVHVRLTEAARKKRRDVAGLYEVEEVAEEVFGTLSHVVPVRMTAY